MCKAIKAVEIGRIIFMLKGAIESSTSIMARHNYGLTCYELGDTNGDIDLVAKGLLDRIHATNIARGRLNLADPTYNVIIELDGVTWDASIKSEHDLTNELGRLYDEYCTACALKESLPTPR